MPVRRVQRQRPEPAAYEFVAEAATADVAEFMCTTKGGHLASVHSDADQDLVANLAGGQSAYIGYHDMHAEGCAAGCAEACTDCPPSPCDCPHCLPQ